MDEKLITGIAKLDEQHERVLSLIQQIKEAIEKRFPKGKILKLVDSLDFYSGEHFDYEEKLAEKCGFEKKDALKESHKEFRGYYNSIKNFYEVQKSSTPIIYALHLAYILEEWLKIHFEELEYDFVEKLKNKIAEGLNIENV